MRPAELQDLLLLDADEALRRRFESGNARRAKLIWGILAAISLAGLVDGLEARAAIRVVLSASSLLALSAFVLARRCEPAFQNAQFVASPEGVVRLQSADGLLLIETTGDGGVKITSSNTLQP